MRTGRFCSKYGTLAAVVLMLVIMTYGPGYCQDSDAIFHWVAGQMEIRRSFAIPAIHLVGKEELNHIFAAGSQRVMTRWVADHGKANADRLMGVYLESAVGLFDPKSLTIYVGGFLTPCRQNAILAHEITHYFQYVVRGAVTSGGMAGEMLLMEREMEACAMERRYEEAMCDDAELLAYATFISIKDALYFP